MEKGITRKVAKYMSGFNYDAITQKTLKYSRMLLMDYLSVAVKGSVTESGLIAQKYVLDSGGAEESLLIGTDKRVPAEQAAFANAISAHSLELDDVDKEALFHFGPPVVSSVLATAEKNNASGKEIISAIAAGTEMMERLSRTMNPALRNRGFHTTPVCGVFGSAIASGVLMNCNEEEMISVLGLAGAQASGVMEMYGESMQKRFNPGPAAKNGIVAVKMAKLGYTGADTILEGERGFCRAYSDELKWDGLLEGLGDSYDLEVEFKPYACARPIHSSIDCVYQINKEMNSAGRNVNEIEEIAVYRHPMWAHYHTSNQPKSYHEAQMSLPYSVALALVKEANFFDDYVAAIKENNKTINDLCLKVNIISDDKFPTEGGCRVVVKLADKTEISQEVKYPKGSIQNPMNFEEHQNKLMKLTGDIIGSEKVTEIENNIADLENVTIEEIMNSLA